MTSEKFIGSSMSYQPSCKKKQSNCVKKSSNIISCKEKREKHIYGGKTKHGNKYNKKKILFKTLKGNKYINY